MSETAVPKRSEIAPEHTWNAPSVFVSDEAWAAELASILESLPAFKQFQGHLGDGPTQLLEALQTYEQLVYHSQKVNLYAGMTHSVDTSNQAAAAMLGKAQSLAGQVKAAVSFLEPEILALGRETLGRWLAEEPRLAIYRHYFDNLFRQQAHVRSAEVEELLGFLADPFAGTESTEAMLVDADFSFQPAAGSDGQELPLTQGTIDDLLANPDRELRRTAWEHYHDTYLAFKNTLASNLSTSIKQNVFEMRARRHQSTLEASLFEGSIPVEVFHNLINTYRQNLPTWHRYWKVRRQALGVETLQPYDVWAPLTGKRVQVPYQQAVDWVCQGLAPLGEDYVNAMRQGCLEERWVDIYPNQGKRSGAFSWGAPGTYPFIVMSYTNDVFGLGTLAHELGHSMHSYLTWQTQPVIYSDYSLFVAEVASNFHQAMVRAYLLENHPDPAFQISVIEEAMANFHRYFFIMPTLARFELEVHQQVERGDGLTADGMIALMAGLFSEGFGDEMSVDRERVGITWATFSHLYADYYVYQYATGISAAHALAQRVLSGERNAAADYLRFLKSGGSMYPLDALKMAGVDLTTPKPVEETFAILSGLVDKLEGLT